MKTLLATVLAAAIALDALPAAAQSHRLDAAWDAALNENTQDIGDAEMAQLNTIAYHSAVARLCDGFAVDETKIAAAANAVVVAETEGMDPAGVMARQADILIALGTAHGLFLAEGSLHLDKFCAEAADARADPEYVDSWQ